MQIEQKLKEETQRCTTYLGVSSKKPMLEIVENKLLKVHVPQILEKGFDNLMVDFCALSPL